MLRGPTAAFGSGGAPVTVNVPPGPLNPWPTPSKPTPRAGAAAVPGLDCTTGSAAVGAGTGRPFLGSFSFFSLPSGDSAGARLASGGETSWLTLFELSAWPPRSARVAGEASATPVASRQSSVEAAVAPDTALCRNTISA